MVKTLTEKMRETCWKNTRREREDWQDFWKARTGAGRQGHGKVKRQQYFKMLNDKKIAQPKEATLLYYKIFKDMSNDKYILLD